VWAVVVRPGSRLIRGGGLLGLGIVLVAGCGGPRHPGRAELQAEIRNLGWDIQQVASDVFVARLDVGEQRRRVRQTLADLTLAPPAGAKARCAVADAVNEDARHAADGVDAVKHDDDRVQADLAYVARDLAVLERSRGSLATGHGERVQLARAAALGHQAVRTLTGETASLVREAGRLRELIDRDARGARASCAAGSRVHV
jgi:hypothetical protein